MPPMPNIIISPMTKVSNGKGKGKVKSTPKTIKPNHCIHSKPDNGKLCAACFVDGTGGEGIRRPCEHGFADNYEERQVQEGM